jgi:hypothetical protein
MAKNEQGKESGFGTSAPGDEALALDSDEELGIIALYATVPSRSLGSVMRFNLFADLGGTRQHVASALAPEGTTGELIVVSGHMADSWHVTVQSTTPRQDCKIGLVGRECCAMPSVQVRADLLALAFSTEGGPELLALLWAPFVPWGGENGAARALSVAGSGSLPFPKGARLTHWMAQGVALPGPAGSVSVKTTPAGPALATGVGNGAPAREVFPDGNTPVSSIDFANLDFGIFEFVV